MIAPGRAKRPGAARAAMDPPSVEELENCPFCAGHEEMTPPHTLVLPDERNWRVRVVPNLYPALERQEVVIHSRRHVRSVGELDDQEITLIAAAWHERAEAAWADGYRYVHTLINEGREAGGSLPHSHSQLVWLRETPPEVRREEPQLIEGACALCDLIEDERAHGRHVIAEMGEVLLLAAYAGRLPYELLVVGDHWGGQTGTDGGVSLIDALRLVAEAVRRLHSLEGPLPLNVWLHNSGHWHFEIVPRLTVLAGLELGAGIYINTLPPEEAANRLRGARSAS